MTALMMLFLLVMCVTLLTLIRASSNTRDEKQQREQAVETVMDEIEAAARASDGVRVDRHRQVIDFGDRAQFDTGSHALSADAARRLRAFAPHLLAVAESETGRRWLRRVVVEGFADPRGSYLMNLNLSLQRGQRVLCALLDPAGTEQGLGAAERLKIRDLFAVGGYSFNAPRESHEASRRIEMRLEFLAIADAQPTARSSPAAHELGECALGR